MAFSLRKSSDRGTVGLDIDGRYLAAAQVVRRSRRARRQPRPAPGPRPRRRGDRRRGARPARSRASSPRPACPSNVRLGVANQQIVVRVVELPRIEDERQRDAAVRFQAAEAIAMPLDEAVLDHQIAGYAQGADGTRAHAGRARGRAPQDDRDAARGREAPPASRPTASTSTPSRWSARSRSTGTAAEDAARVFCHLGGVTNLAIAVGSSCFFTRPLSAVWDDEDAGSRLADEIRLSIDYYMTQPQARPVGEVVLSGPGSADARAGREPRRAPRHPRRGGRAARPDRRLGPRPGRGSAPLHRGGRPLPGSGGMKPVNLLPAGPAPALRQATAARAPTSCSACSPCCSRWSAAYVLTTNKVTERKNEAAAATAEADRLEAQAAAQGTFTDFARSRRPALQSVAGVAADPLRLGALHARALARACPRAAGSRPPTPR